MNKELIKELLNLDNVKLVAVSKKHSKEEIDEMIEKLEKSLI